MSRITAAITYNLKDRKRLHTGEDRPEYQVPYLVAHINSPAVQEFVKKGDLYGYCGHQIRQLYGMQPPETVIINGKEIRIESASHAVKPIKQIVKPLLHLGLIIFILGQWSWILLMPQNLPIDQDDS